jgi:predicted ribosomally synthesized peptide with SipW-like signal peptide
MKKRTIMIGSAILLAVLLVAGGTMAWFTDTVEVTNMFKAGTVDVDLIENDEMVVGEEFNGLTFENVNPGDTYNKKITVKSNGSKRTYVRIKLTPKWMLAQGMSFPQGYDANSLPPAELVGLNSDWIEMNGYYYYKDILTTGVETSELITGVMFDGPTMTNDYQGATFKLKVEVDAIQATHDAYQSWGIGSLPAGVETITP